MSAAAAVPIRARAVQQPFDVERIRGDFPILHTRVHGHPLVYLDNAATSQKPRSVIDAIVRYYEGENANIHRGVHYLSQVATEEFEKARETVRGFVNAAQSSEIIFTRGTTEAINLVAQTYGRAHLGAGDEVLITAMEHHSNIVPWQMLCEGKGAKLRVAPINDAGELLLDVYRELGLTIEKADNAVVPGLLRCWDMLSTQQLRVFSTLRNWRNEIRLYKRNEKGEIIKKNDHLMDAMRYNVMSGRSIAKVAPDAGDGKQWFAWSPAMASPGGVWSG